MSQSQTLLPAACKSGTPATAPEDSVTLDIMLQAIAKLAHIHSDCSDVTLTHVMAHKVAA